MVTAGLKRTRSPSASSAVQPGEISPAPVQGSSKDVDGSNGHVSNDEDGWTAVPGSSKKKAKKQKVKKLEVGMATIRFLSSGYMTRPLQHG